MVPHRPAPPRDRGTDRLWCFARTWTRQMEALNTRLDPLRIYVEQRWGDRTHASWLTLAFPKRQRRRRRSGANETSGQQGERVSSNSASLLCPIKHSVPQPARASSLCVSASCELRFGDFVKSRGEGFR